MSKCPCVSWDLHLMDIKINGHRSLRMAGPARDKITGNEVERSRISLVNSSLSLDISISHSGIFFFSLLRESSFYTYNTEPSRNMILDCRYNHTAHYYHLYLLRRKSRAALKVSYNRTKRRVSSANKDSSTMRVGKQLVHISRKLRYSRVESRLIKS